MQVTDWDFLEEIFAVFGAGGNSLLTKGKVTTLWNNEDAVFTRRARQKPDDH